MLEYLSGFIPFLQWFGLSIVLLGVFCLVYLWATPHRELKLIREGNISAAMCLGGAIIGYVLPLASVLVHGTNIVDFAIWGVIAMLVQLAAYLLLRIVFKDLSNHIVEDERSVAILAAGVSLSIGILNAAAQTG